MSTFRPRRSDPTRARILEAARRQFAAAGYENTTIRGVAADAGIDPSMVMRYYGSKEGLFAVAADIELNLPDLRDVPRRALGRQLARHFFARWEERPGESSLGLLLRTAATNAHAAERLRTIADVQIAGALAAAGIDRPQRRASLIASQMLGLGYCRYVLALPGIVAADPEELIADVGATLQRYITGPLAEAG